MAWRRARGELDWHRCRNCRDYPADDSDHLQISGDPTGQPGGVDENPICERCDELLRANECEGE